MAQQARRGPTLNYVNKVAKRHAQEQRCPAVLTYIMVHPGVHQKSYAEI